MSNDIPANDTRANDIPGTDPDATTERLTNVGLGLPTWKGEPEYREPTLHATASPHTASRPTGQNAAARQPRIRWGAIVWGTIVTVVAVTVLVIIGSPDRRTAFVAWLESMGAGGFIMIGFLAVGFTILVLSLLAMVRRAQRTPHAS